ncbi:hypothetical protein EZV62_000588 [Acer yangbiense]|uniref:CCHC-type domain-containing protein n=1 Tax=Acer yangbiense TaxID=1000413 RepID=A0A5C7ISE3_9ROSI|nr:hypothetical protein EZV62_000588 [Acer yangbiense]
MSADEVARLCKALSLKDSEGPLMPLKVELKKDGVKRMGFRLIGKLLSNKLVNRDAFTSLFPRIWRTMEDFEIEVISGNTFSFTFKSANDRWQVLQGGPWSFDKALLVLEEPTGKGDIQRMKFNKVAFWVQIHNVPLLCMTAEIGKFLGEMVGEVKEVDTGKSGECVGKYIRVRVVIQVDKPLRRILRVDVMRDGLETTMLLKYERLPEHCFRCGLLGHTVRYCVQEKVGDGPENYDQLFGSWLKADSPVMIGRFRQRGTSNRYEEGTSATGILGAGPIGVTGSARKEVAGDRVVADFVPDLGVDSRVPISSNNKGKNVVQVRRNIDSSLVKEGTTHASSVDADGNLQSGLAVREVDDVHDKVIESRASKKCVTPIASAQANSIHVEEAILHGNVSIPIVDDVPSGGTELVENKARPKVGKWKCRARDGVKPDSDPQGGSNLGKRNSGT